MCWQRCVLLIIGATTEHIKYWFASRFLMFVEANFRRPLPGCVYMGVLILLMLSSCSFFPVDYSSVCVCPSLVLVLPGITGTPMVLLLFMMSQIQSHLSTSKDGWTRSPKTVIMFARSWVCLCCVCTALCSYRQTSTPSPIFKPQSFLNAMWAPLWLTARQGVMLYW